MANESINRKLTAILSADVEGYSRLMSQDEVGTIKVLKAHREMIADFIEQYKGRVIDSPGDNILAAFESVSNAVNCAVEIQRDLAERNAEIPSARMMQWRIGVNLGDLIEQDSQIFGDGVNIAARVEKMAEPGGICISGTVYDHVKSKLGLEYESLGHHEVKNIPEPVSVYRVLSYPGAAAHRVVKVKGDVTKKWHKITLSVVAVAILCVGSIFIWNYLKQPEIKPDNAVQIETDPAPSEKPSIAVLPFDNMSGDPEQEYFADGMTEEIINRLSLNPMLTVIARNSTFFYKGKQIQIQQVGKELNARYIVEGSVRKSGNRMRITAQLIDTASQGHVWSKAYDREMVDIFKLQDEVAQQIVSALNAEYSEAELMRVRRLPTNNLTAYDFFQRGMSHFRIFTEEETKTAAKMFERAILLDPEYALAYATLGYTHHWNYMFYGGDSQSLEQAYKLLRKALSLDESIPIAHIMIANVYRFKGQIEQAFAAVNRAISLNPNDPTSHLFLGSLYSGLGRSKDALKAIKKSMHLNPHYQVDTLTELAWAYRGVGKYKDALSALDIAITRNPDYPMVYSEQTQTYRDMWLMQLTDDPQCMDKAVNAAEKLSELNDNTWYLSNSYLLKKEYDKAIAIADKMLAVSPNPGAKILKALIFNSIGRANEAIKLIESAIQESIVSLPWHYTALGSSLSLEELHTESLSAYKKALELNPHRLDSFISHVNLTILHAKMNQMAEAKTEASEVLKLVPTFSVKVWGERSPMKDREQVERDMAALRKAGLK